ncbi:hypothetical protein GCM10010840_28290 [Deinococcus aerolatus]|uniref:DUF3887 domain-containing protein n=1 Tax=Deinococcus aerolatus TaxID=522487 RepID=A0ABQ2GDC7_9DEIO|nr:hypothetical protein [Deinococcus aerolatus]GGL88653.1 hypothetical protein GCM10010840_28290 [Deinococcus aerolatus]
MNPTLLMVALALLVLSPSALAQGTTAAPPRPPAAAATRTPAEQAAFTRGRALMTEFLALRLERLWNSFTPAVQGQWGTLDGFTTFRKTGIEQYGRETKLVRERTFMQGNEAVYVRSAIYEKFPDQVWAFVMGFTGDRVTTFGVLLEEERTDDPVALGH